jgi:hypothetical protein
MALTLVFKYFYKDRKLITSDLRDLVNVFVTTPLTLLEFQSRTDSATPSVRVTLMNSVGPVNCKSFNIRLPAIFRDSGRLIID